MDLPKSFERDRYVVVRSLLKDQDLALTYRYARKVAEAGLLRMSDSQVTGTPNAYGDLVMDGLLGQVAPEIERISGLSLFPTYSYFRVYRRGDVLERHTDRPSCEISVSLSLGFEAERPWPIWIEGPHGVTSIALKAGDALLYRGIECPHWREAFQGGHQAQVFLHYVDQIGPHAEWRYDKRKSLTHLPPIATV